MSDNPLEALQAARDVMARVAELEAELEGARQARAKVDSLYSQEHLRADGLEAEVEGLRQDLEDKHPFVDVRALQARAEKAEAKVENLQHNLERCRDGYTQTERIRKRTAARLEQAIGGWNEAYLRAERAEAKLAEVELDLEDERRKLSYVHESRDRLRAKLASTGEKP